MLQCQISHHARSYLKLSDVKHFLAKWSENGLREFKPSQDETDEDVSATKKRKIDESVVLIKPMNVKRPVLNPDILDDVLACVLAGSCCLTYSTSLQKFMLSGKEPFAAGLRMLSKLSISTVSILWSTFMIKPDSYLGFPYDFPRLNDILNVIDSNKGLEIKHFPRHAYQKRILTFFVHKDLKTIKFSSEWDPSRLPADYIKFFKNECNFDQVTFNHCSVNKPTLFDVFMMKSAQHKIQSHFKHFLTNLMHIEEGKIFHAVQKLEFRKASCYEHKQTKKFIFTVDAMKDFFSHLTVHFPSLTLLDAKLGTSYADGACCEWFEAYQALLEFNPEMFDYIPSRIKESISIRIDNDNITFADVMKKTGITFEDEIVDTDDETYMLVKKFDIHEGLEFEFILYFHEYMCEMDSDLSDATDGENV